MVGTDVDKCLADHIDQLFIHLCVSLLNLLLCNTDRLRCDLHSVKFLCVLKKRCVLFYFYGV